MKTSVPTDGHQQQTHTTMQQHVELHKTTKPLKMGTKNHLQVISILKMDKF